MDHGNGLIGLNLDGGDMRIDRDQLLSGLAAARERLFGDPENLSDGAQVEVGGNGDVPDMPVGALRDVVRNVPGELDSLRVQLRNLDLQHQVLAQEMVSMREAIVSARIRGGNF